jgi:hypothetical protein
LADGDVDELLGVGVDGGPEEQLGQVVAGVLVALLRPVVSGVLDVEPGLVDHQSNAAPLNPMEAVLLSMLLEQERRIAELEQAVDAAEQVSPRS